MWVPLENVSGGGSNACVASSPAPSRPAAPSARSTPSGRAGRSSCPRPARPRTRTAPSTSSRSSSGASSRCAAIRNSFSFRMRAAPSAAPALTTPPRAAARPHAVRRGGRVAGLHAHLLDRDGQRVGQRLGDRRQVPLALADDADLRRDGAARLDPHDGGVVARSRRCRPSCRTRSRTCSARRRSPRRSRRCARPRAPRLARAAARCVVERRERALERLARIDRP